MYSVNPFDPRTVLLAKHAQHVALVHFPIALFIAGAVFDGIGQWKKWRAVTEAAYYNFLLAALSLVPVLASGIMAWQFQLEGQKLKGVLLLHLIAGWTSAVLIVLSWWSHFRARGRGEPLPGYRLAIEAAGVVAVALTGHLGGFVSGVSGGV